MKRAAIALMWGLVAGVALAQGAPENGAARNDATETVRLEPQENGWEIEELIERITDLTGHPLLYEPNNPAIRGKKIRWTGTVDVPKGELFRWFRGVLSTQRLVVIPVGPREADLWMVVEINATQVGNHPEYVPPEELVDWKDADGCYITTTLSVNHLEDTSRARNALAQLSTRPNGKINDIPNGRAFVIADFAPVVWAMAEQLRQMDVLAKREADETPKPSAPEPAPSQRRRDLEQFLVGSRTDKAAEYFIEEIRKLDGKANGGD